MTDYNIFSVNELIVDFADKNDVFPGAVLIAIPETYMHPPANTSMLDTLIELGSITMSTVRQAIDAVVGDLPDVDPVTVYGKIKKLYIILDRESTFTTTFIDFFIARHDNDPYKHTYDKKDIAIITQFFSELRQDAPTISIGGNVRIDTLYKSVEDELIEESDRAIDIREITTQLLKSFKGDIKSKTTSLETSKNISKSDGSMIDENDIRNIFSSLNLSHSTPYIFYRDRSGAHYKLHPGRDDVPSKDMTKDNVLYIGSNIRIDGSESVLIYKGILSVDIDTEIHKLGYILDAEYQLSFSIEFEMKNEMIDYHIFHDMILNDPYMGTYLYMSDSGYKLGDASKTKIFYRNPRVPLPGLAKQKSNPVLMYITNKAVNHVNGGGFVITIEQISGDFLIAELSVNISALIQRYFEQRSSLIQEYVSIFGEDLVNKSVKLTNLELLKTLKPKFFAGNYSKRCSGQSHQPLLISKSDYDKLPESTKSISSMKFEDPDFGLDGDPNPIWLTCHNNEAHKYIYIPSRDDSPCCKSSEVTINESSPASMKSLSNAKSELKEGKYGHIVGFNQLFTSKSNGKQFSVRRIGINQQRNAFLECVSYLLHSSLGVKTTKEGVRLIINKLAKSKYITAFKQCIYEYSDGEIRDYLNSSITYDSDLVCDGLSHVLNVNIFVLDVQEKSSTIRIPRYKFMYYRTIYSKWPSIFVYRYEHKRMTLYEPIVLAREGLPDMLTFTGLDSAIKHKLESNLVSKAIDVLTGKAIIHAQFVIETNPNEWMNRVQIVDSYGKLAGDIDKEIPIIYHYRADPVQGPYISTKDLILPTYESVQKSSLSKQFTEISTYKLYRTSNNLLQWKSSPSMLESIPTTDIDAEIRLKHNNIIYPMKLGEALRLRSLILQYTAWLFVLSESTNAVEFAEKYIIIDKNVNYKFSTGTVFLPQDISFVNALTYLEQTHLTLNGKIVVPSDQIMYALEYHFDLITKIPGKHHSPMFIVDDSAATTNKNEIIINGEKNLNIYIKQLDPMYGIPISHITVSMSKLYNPYMIITPEGNTYIIQNVEEVDSKARSINCAIQWYNKKVNTGYNTYSLDAGVLATIYPYISEYVLDVGLSIVPRGDDGTIKILHYGGRYAAILSL